VGGVFSFFTWHRFLSTQAATIAVKMETKRPINANSLKK
jgi:hypothetical protein